MTTMEHISEVSKLMQIPFACPADVRARIAALRVPVEDAPPVGRMSTNWRSGHAVHRAPHGGGGSSSGSRRPVHGVAPPRYGNKGKADVSVEERMMDRIRDKMNKFSEATYDPIKSWLCQLLDSGQTDFLTEFITLVFEKAAMEKMFCPLYARLITELCGSFPHLEGEMKRIFAEFMGIFVEANEPAEGSEYKSYLALRERRKYRRGYSMFLGEIARLKVISTDEVLKTCTIILDGLVLAKGLDEQQLLCEEYADCLTVLVKGIDSATLAPIVPKVKLAMDRVGSPSLSNKARFALMDIMDRV